MTQNSLTFTRAFTVHFIIKLLDQISILWFRIM